MSNRVPPGGYSSFSFGSYEAVTPPVTPARPSPLLGEASSPAAAQPATGGRRFGGVHKSSIVFGDSETPSSAAKQPSTRGNSNIFAQDTTPTKPVTARTPVTVIPLEDPQPFIPSKRIITPPASTANNIPEEQKFVPGLRQGVVNHNSSSFTLGIDQLSVSDSDSNTAVAGTSSNTRKLESSVVLGDDSPRSPEFGPRKHKPGVKLLKKEEPLRNLGEFSGYDGVEGKASKDDKKLDPASVEMVAGKNSGKHRVY